MKFEEYNRPDIRATAHFDPVIINRLIEEELYDKRIVAESGLARGVSGLYQARLNLLCTFQIILGNRTECVCSFFHRIEIQGSIWYPHTSVITTL